MHLIKLVVVVFGKEICEQAALKPSVVGVEDPQNTLAFELLTFTKPLVVDGVSFHNTYMVSFTFTVYTTTYICGKNEDEDEQY